MKRLILLLVTLALLLPATAVLASDVSSAEYITNISITNNSTDDKSSVATVLTLSTADMKDSNMLNATADDCATHREGAVDTAFMPSVNSTYPWCIFVPVSDAVSVANNYLYSGDVTGGKIRYFPAAAGMTTADAASLELSDNFIATLAGFFNTDAGADKSILVKEDAISVNVSSTVSGNIMVTISRQDFASVNLTPNAAGDYTNLTPNAGSNWDCVNDPPGTPDELATYVHYSASPMAWDAYNVTTIDLPDGSVIDNVSVFMRVYGDAIWPSDYRSGLRLGGVESLGTLRSVPTILQWYEYNEVIAKPGGGAWLESDLTDLQVLHGINYGGNTPGACTQTYVIVDYHIPEAAVTALDVDSGEHEVEVKGSPDSDTWATGSVLQLDDVASSSINCGPIYNASTKLWISFWFRLDYAHTAASPTRYILGKSLNFPNDLLLISLNNGTGKLHFTKNDGGVASFSITSTETSWNANQWYHVIASISSANGARLIIDGGTARTNADTSVACNGGNFIIGDYVDPGGVGIDGRIINVIIGTDDLTEAEEADLYAGIAPADATDYWYVDEGGGTDVISYGSEGNGGTVGALCVWTTANYIGSDKTGRLCDFVIKIDDTEQRTGINAFGKDISVPDNANALVTCMNDSVMYLESQEITVGGAQVQYIEWELDTTFHDSSGYSNDATPTFRTASSDADVVATITSQASTAEQGQPAVATTGGWIMIPEVPDTPSELFTEGGTNYPGGPEIAALANDLRTPYESLAYPLAIGSAILVFAWIFGATHRAKTGVRGSLLLACIGAEVTLCFWVFGGGGVINGFVLIPFGIISVFMLMIRNPQSPVVG